MSLSTGIFNFSLFIYKLWNYLYKNKWFKLYNYFQKWIFVWKFIPTGSLSAVSLLGYYGYSIYLLMFCPPYFPKYWVAWTSVMAIYLSLFFLWFIFGSKILFFPRCKFFKDKNYDFHFPYKYPHISKLTMYKRLCWPNYSSGDQSTYQFTASMIITFISVSWQ